MQPIRLAGIILAISLLIPALISVPPTGLAAEASPDVKTSGKDISGSPFESGLPFTPRAVLDHAFQDAWSVRGVEPAGLCSDEVFLRRIYLDLIGTLPEPKEIRAFLADTRPDRRAAWIETLFERDEFADYWSLKWCDLLRVKAEFPINLWPNAVQAYHRWIHDALRTNRTYDAMARSLLTASGSNFRVPPANFYRALQGQEPGSIAKAVALTFMGVRLETADPAMREGLEAIFSRVAFKRTAEWKEDIVHLDPSIHAPLTARLPDGTELAVPAGEDPRFAFADWLITEDNPWFARNLVNRAWSWFLGRGIIHETDDLRPDNPPVLPGVLTCLESEFTGSGYDLRHLFRLILNSSVYQQSSIPRGDPAEAERYFACYPVRRIEAEVLIDMLCRFTGTTESYMSPIPEPFTFIPEAHRSITLADGSISSPFLEMFGRPPRDTGLEGERLNAVTEAQRLHLLNSSHVQKKIEGGKILKSLVKENQGKGRPLITSIYLHLLSRKPTEEEVTAAMDYFRAAGGISKPEARAANRKRWKKRREPRENRALKYALDDLVWALINSKEFLYRH